MPKQKLDKIKESVYPCFCVFAKVAVVLVVRGTLLHQTLSLAIVVNLVPLG
jgi:hypothetical protein